MWLNDLNWTIPGTKERNDLVTKHSGSIWGPGYGAELTLRRPRETLSSPHIQFQRLVRISDLSPQSTWGLGVPQVLLCFPTILSHYSLQCILGSQLHEMHTPMANSLPPQLSGANQKKIRCKYRVTSPGIPREIQGGRAQGPLTIGVTSQ